MDKKLKHFNPMSNFVRNIVSVVLKTDSPFSSFWSDNDWNTRRTEFIDIDEDVPKKRGVDHIQLSQYRESYFKLCKYRYWS